MPGDFKLVHIKQVFCFNSVHINEVPLYVSILCTCITRECFLQFADKGGPDLELVTCSGHAKNGALCILQVD